MERPAPGAQDGVVAEAAQPSGTSDAPAEEPCFGVIGYLLSDKKRRSLLTPDFLSRARLRGLRFVPVDPHRPLEEQEGHPFDVILHKLPSSSPDIRDWEARLGAYKRANPWVSIVDTPQAARQLSNRATMLQAVEGVCLGEAIGTTVAVPRQVVVDGDVDAVRAALRHSGLAFPVLAKSLLADGSESSHALALVHDDHGLYRLANGDVPGLRPPCVLQEFVDHGGSLFKVYVVGDAVTTARRRSLPDMRCGSQVAHAAPGDGVAGAGAGADGHADSARGDGACTSDACAGAQCGTCLARTSSNGHVVGGLEAVDRISTLGVHWRGTQAAGAQLGDSATDASPHANAAWASAQAPGAYVDGGGDAATPPGYVVEGADAVLEPGAAFVHALAMALQASLGLQLFNFDLIRVNGEQDRFLVVDINYFPGIAKMPGYESVFADFLRRSADTARAKAAQLQQTQAPSDAARDVPLPCSAPVQVA